MCNKLSTLFKAKFSQTRLANTTGLWLMLSALLSDTLILMLVAFVGFMTLEGLIPGIVSSHLSLAKFLFVIVITFSAVIALRYAYPLDPSLPQAPTQWLTRLLLFWSFLLISNALLKFPLYAIVVILVFTSIIAFMFYRLFFPERQ